MTQYLTTEDAPGPVILVVTAYEAAVGFGSEHHQARDVELRPIHDFHFRHMLHIVSVESRRPLLDECSDGFFMIRCLVGQSLKCRRQLKQGVQTDMLRFTE